ncbi:MAG: FG-GAP-like repeat-containing protein [Bacteroidota bacterium]
MRKKYALGWVIPIYVMLCTPLALGQAPTVTSLFPASQTVTAAATTELMLTFDLPVDPISVDASAIFVFGRWSGVREGAISLESDNTVLRFVPNKPFMAGEWVTVSLARSIQSMAGEPMAHGYTWNFWTRSAPAGFDFSQIDDISTRFANEGRVRSYGAYAGDLNRDGYSDLMIPNEDVNDIRIFLNDGAGGYSDFDVYPIPEGDTPSPIEGSDFNRDGMIDFAVGNTQSDKISVWMGQANGSVSHEQNAQADTEVRGLCTLDLDGDTMMDIVTTNRSGVRGTGTISLLRNNGSGSFTAPVNIETGSSGETACASADANNDGILDVFIGTYTGNELLLYLGDGQGNVVFSEKVSVGARPWMLAAGDVNGDGFADVVSSNTGNATVSVVLGNGDGTLQEAANYETGVFPLALDLGDLDGDGDLDLVTSNFSSNDYTVLENTGDGAYIHRLTLPATTAASCTILHDRDNDGDLDITAIDELADRIFLFDNISTATAVEEETQPTAFSLNALYPNPFSTQTTFDYQLEKEAVVSVAIYNQLGQQVRRINTGAQAPGRYTLAWDGRNTAGIKVPAGVYVTLFQAGNETIRQTIVFTP